jgi:hypothetical protein
MNEAAALVVQIDRRIAGAKLQLERAKREQQLQEKAFVHAEEIETFLRTKFTSQEHCDWMRTQLRRLFRQCFDVALESAKLAEQCYKEQRDPSAKFITVKPPQTAREELMAGHELLACLREMDRSWIATDARGPELVRHVSLKQINPWALYHLREEGEAEFTIPDVLFDLDHPTHYDRRLRSVQVTISCVAGPYAPVTGTLTVTGSRRRRKPTDANLTDDPPSGSPSIALSSGRDDAGLFELSLADERFLPFENLGAEIDCKLTLPKKIRHYSYRTIYDVILTLRLTAKTGAPDRSDSIKDALNKLKSSHDGQQFEGPFQLVSLRHDFPDDWLRFQSGAALTVTLTPQLLPYVLREALEPELKDVLAIRMEKGKPGEDDGPREIQEVAGGWTIEVSPAIPSPADLEDVYLLSRFQL